MQHLATVIKVEGDKINILHIIELIAFCYHPVTWEAKLREGKGYSSKRKQKETIMFFFAGK